MSSTAYDELPGDGMLRQLYEWDPLVDFIAAVLRKEKMYRLADPLGCCSVNVFKPGFSHAYHFDESEFSTTLCLQTAEEGGAFEYTSRLRESADDMVYDEVSGKRCRANKSLN